MTGSDDPVRERDGRSGYKTLIAAISSVANARLVPIIHLMSSDLSEARSALTSWRSDSILPLSYRFACR